MEENKRKLRVLWCGEASFLYTGYAIYAKEVLTRLHKTEKYTIAEMGCYSSHDNPKIHQAPWKFYPTLPINQEESDFYNSDPKNQFGEWRFDDICLDFRPDVVIDVRDWWMLEFQHRSAYRDFYQWAIMPTVDSAPQQPQYLNTYMGADAVFTYSEYGKHVLETETNKCIEVLGIPSPGADFDALKPSTNKKSHRESFGFVDDVKIVGTIMRNQRRKLYPNLISSFRKMLDENPKMQKNTFLYIHTFYPDLGWDLPYFIKKNNMGNHTLLTYKCKECQHFFPSFYSGALTSCPNCGSNSAVMPGTQFGVTTQELSAIINFFDLYVQYSVCEGFGMPQVEAAACGVPVLTVDYSAMNSVGKNIKADFVSLSGLYWDSPTHSERAIPNDKDLVKKMVKFLNMPESIKRKKGMDSYIAARKRYTWNGAAKTWEKYLDGVVIKNHVDTWDSNPKNYNIPVDIPENITNELLVSSIIKGSPIERDGYIALRLLKDLNYGKSTVGNASIYYDESSYVSENHSYAPFTKKDAVRKVQEIYKYYNERERKRQTFSRNNGWGKNSKPEFLKYAKPENQ